MDIHCVGGKFTVWCHTRTNIDNQFELMVGFRDCDAFVASYKTDEERKAALRNIARQAAALAGEKLACDLNEEEANQLYNGTSW